MILKDQIALRAGVMGRNNRYYSQDIVNKINEDLQSKIADGYFLGEISGWSRPDETCVNLKNASHVVTKSYVEGADLKIDVRLLDTPAGKILQDMWNATPKCLVFRHKAVGTVGPAGNVQDITVISFNAVPASEDPYLGIIV